MNNMYDILAKLDSVNKQRLDEGWKSELAGGTAGGIAGNFVGNAIAPGIGGVVGGALGATAGGIAGRSASNDINEASRLNEIAPLIAAGARVAMPMIGKIAQALSRGASTAGKATADVAGKAATGVGRGVADVSKEVGKTAVQNAPAVGVGVGAYEIAKQISDKMPDAVNQIYTDAGQAAKAVTSVVGDALDGATIAGLAGAAVKYAIPVGLLLGMLYGGKKLIDKVMSEDIMMEENNMRDLLNKLDYVTEGWKGTATGAGLGAFAGGPVGAAVGALAGDKIGDEMDEASPVTAIAKTAGSLAGDTISAPGDFLDAMEETSKYGKMDEISMDSIGRGIGKAIGVPARIAGAVAGIPGGMKQAYQSSKAGAQRAISGQDMDCYPKVSKVPVGEGDMDEGNDFTKARLDAIKAGKPTFKLNGKTYRVTGDTSDEKVMEREFSSRDEFDRRAERGDTVRTAQGTLTKTDKGVRHERRADDDIDTDDRDDDEPKKKGRPKGSKRAIGAKVKGTSKLHSKPAIKETDLEEDYDRDEYDEEGEMAKSQARTIEDAAQELQDILGDNENLPEWVQKKITLALEYIDTARDYMAANRPEQDNMAMAETSTGDYSAKKARAGKDIGKPGKTFAKIAKSAGERYGSKERGEKVAGAVLAKLRAKEGAGEELEEKAVSKAQRAAAGIAYAAKKGDIPKSELRGASKEMAKMATGELKKFAKTKEKGLPEKKKEVDETTVSGSVATSDAAPKVKKGGMQFGKGVYEGAIAESFNTRLNSILTEGMSINMSANEDGTKSLSVNATDEDAIKLATILKLAGMQQAHDYEEACPACGKTDCGCEEGVAEGEYANSPDVEESDTDTMINTLSGGLNGPKLQVNPNNMGDNPLAMRDLAKAPSGQINLGKVSENVVAEAETRLWDLYKRYENK